MKISKELLEKLYIEEGLTQHKIAKQIGTSQSSVTIMLKKYGINKPKKHKKTDNPYPNNGKLWTNKEIDLLTQLYGTCSYESLAKRLKRSIKSIEYKKHRLSLGRSTEAIGEITANQLALYLNRSAESIKRWTRQNELPVHKRVLKLEKEFYMINIEEFWEWAKDNPLMDWNKYKTGSLPNEPEWLAEAKKKNNKDVLRRWNKTEEALLLFYYNQKIPLKEIAKKLNRSMNSIDARLRHLKAKRKLVSIRWKPLEIKILLDLKSQGKSNKEIAEELGRSTDSVNKKCESLKQNKMSKVI